MLEVILVSFFLLLMHGNVFGEQKVVLAERWSFTGADFHQGNLSTGFESNITSIKLRNTHI